jgi:hypothetical protein
MEKDPKYILDFSDENLSKTHEKHETLEKGFMFHDLNGKPMMMKDFKVIRWIPKK